MLGLQLTIHLHVDHPIHVHLHAGVPADILEAIRAVEDALTEGEQVMTEAMNRLVAAVERSTSVKSSASTLIHGLAERIRTNVGNPAQLHALADEIDAESDKLESAVTAGTVAEDEPPVDPIPPPEV